MRISLQIQILLALLLLGALFFSVLAVNERLFERALADQQQLSIAHEVTRRAADLERRSHAYAEVAPREFVDYNRDLLVYFVGLRDDLDHLQETVEAFDQVTLGGEPETTMAAKNLSDTHKQFVTGLWDKLGDDRTAPRLEWGASFMAEQAPGMRAAAERAEQAIADAAETHLTEARTLTRLSWVLGMLAIAGITVWFWRRVAHRIGRAAEGCRQVAEGEFGTRIEDASRDELGAFSHAFNSLSSRTRVVLGVIDRLPESATAEQAFATLWDESRAHLGHHWQAMLSIEEDSRIGKLIALKHDAGFEFADNEKQFNLAGIIETLELEEKGAAVFADVRRHTLDNLQGRLLRELSRNDLRTLALVLLRDKRGKSQRVLAFAWGEANAEDQGVARFLSGLGRFLSRLLLSSNSNLPTTRRA